MFSIHHHPLLRFPNHHFLSPPSSPLPPFSLLPRLSFITSLSLSSSEWELWNPKLNPTPNQLVGYSNFIRLNPKSDRFAVHHIEFWCEDVFFEEMPEESSFRGLNFGLRRLDHAVGNAPELAPAIIWRSLLGFMSLLSLQPKMLGRVKLGWIRPYWQIMMKWCCF